MVTSVFQATVVRTIVNKYSYSQWKP